MIRLVLLAIIAFYRRWISGQGPLRRVRCSFAAHESCSAYGLRIATSAASGRVAIARIFRRLRRCGDACLRSDGRVLSWTPLHDEDPAAIAAAMRADDELAASIDVMLRTRRAVAVWRDDAAAIRACDAIATAAPPFPAAAIVVALAPLRRPRHPAIVKFGAMMRRAVERLRRRAGLALLALGTLAIVPSWIDAAIASVLVAAVVLTARGVMRASARFELHRAGPRRGLV